MSNKKCESILLRKKFAALSVGAQLHLKRTEVSSGGFVTTCCPGRLVSYSMRCLISKQGQQQTLVQARPQKPSST